LPIAARSASCNRNAKSLMRLIIQQLSATHLDVPI
jgi:hypothetical protein